MAVRSWCWTRTPRGRDQDYIRFLAWEAASARKQKIPGQEERQRRISKYGNEIRLMQENGQLPSDMNWRLIQLATYPLAFSQITRLVTGKEATNPEFQAESTEFLRKLGSKLFG